MTRHESAIKVRFSVTLCQGMYIAFRVIGAGGRERLLRAGVPGIADIIGWTDLGRFLAIETNNPAARGKLSPMQVEWGHTLDLAGGVYIVARSADEMVEKLVERNVISREAAA